MLTKRDIDKIRKLYYENGYSQNRIARETGFNRATVKKYLSEDIEGGKSAKVKLKQKKDLFQKSKEKREEEKDIESEIKELEEAERRETICIDVKEEAFLIALGEVLDTLLPDLNKDVKMFMEKLAQYNGELSPEDFYAQLVLNNVDEEKADQATALYDKYLSQIERQGPWFFVEKIDKEGRFKCLQKNYH